MMLFTLLVSLFLLAQVNNIDALTPYDGTWTEQCGYGGSFSRIESSHSNHHEDRRWSFYCKYDSRVTSTCSWSGWVNDWDGELLYECPDGVIAGVHSMHSNKREDRRFDFKCCKTVKNYRRNCYWSHCANDWDGEMDYSVPAGKFLTGANSHHDNGREDRRWRFLVCEHH